MKVPTAVKVPCKDNKTAHKDAPAERAAAAIRERSRIAELISESEILGIVKYKDLLPSVDSDKAGGDAAVIFTQLVQENEDIHKLTGAGSEYYYSSFYMTETYAKILFYKTEDHLRLIAETVRQNSYEYQRPVPFDFFTKPPFKLSYDQILGYLKTMAETAGYEDIVNTTTSNSGIYLYSTFHLEAEYAEMLAEWLDVGQSDNP
jgi:hypothetical protein